MILALQIAVGIWLGTCLFSATVWAFLTIAEKISKNLRRGYSWWEVWA